MSPKALVSINTTMDDSLQNETRIALLWQDAEEHFHKRTIIGERTSLWNGRFCFFFDEKAVIIAV